MKQWVIKYWPYASKKQSVEFWLNKLDHEQFKSLSKELKLLGLCGNELALPHSRPLGKGLFELRERRYGLRIYYGFYKTRIIVLLVAGDKSTQSRDITVAREILLQLEKGKELV